MRKKIEATVANSKEPRNTSRNTSQLWGADFLSKGGYLLPRPSSFHWKSWTGKLSPAESSRQCDHENRTEGVQ